MRGDERDLKRIAYFKRVESGPMCRIPRYVHAQLSELRKRCRKSKHSQIPCDLSKAGKLWSACCLGFLTLANNRVSYECCHGYRLAGVGKQRGKVRQAGLFQHLTEVCDRLLRWENLYFIRSPPDRKDNTSVSNAFRTAHRKNGLHQGADH